MFGPGWNRTTGWPGPNSQQCSAGVVGSLAEVRSRFEPQPPETQSLAGWGFCPTKFSSIRAALRSGSRRCIMWGTRGPGGTRPDFTLREAGGLLPSSRLCRGMTHNSTPTFCPVPCRTPRRSAPRVVRRSSPTGSRAWNARDRRATGLVGAGFAAMAAASILRQTSRLVTPKRSSGCSLSLLPGARTQNGSKANRFILAGDLRDLPKISKIFREAAVLGSSRCTGRFGLSSWRI